MGVGERGVLISYQLSLAGKELTQVQFRAILDEKPRGAGESQPSGLILKEKERGVGEIQQRALQQTVEPVSGMQRRVHFCP